VQTSRLFQSHNVTVGYYTVFINRAFTAGRIGRCPPPFWIFRTIWAMRQCPPPLGGNFLGEDYGIFGRAVALQFFSESKQILGIIFIKLATPFRTPRNATDCVQYTL